MYCTYTVSTDSRFIFGKVGIIHMRAIEYFRSLSCDLYKAYMYTRSIIFLGQCLNVHVSYYFEPTGCPDVPTPQATFYIMSALPKYRNPMPGEGGFPLNLNKNSTYKIVRPRPTLLFSPVIARPWQL